MMKNYDWQNESKDSDSDDNPQGEDLSQIQQLVQGYDQHQNENKKHR